MVASSLTKNCPPFFHQCIQRALDFREIPIRHPSIDLCGFWACMPRNTWIYRRSVPRSSRCVAFVLFFRTGQVFKRMLIFQHSKEQEFQCTYALIDVTVRGSRFKEVIHVISDLHLPKRSRCLAAIIGKSSDVTKVRFSRFRAIPPGLSHSILARREGRLFICHKHSRIGN